MSRESHGSTTDRRDQQERQANATKTVLDRLRNEQIQVERLDQHRFRVGKDFMLWPAIGRWRSADGAQQGYDVGDLIKAVKAAAPPSDVSREI